MIGIKRRREIKQGPIEAFVSQYQFSVTERDIRYGVVWRQYITQDGKLIGTGAINIQKTTYRRRGYGALMSVRILKMREAYKKRMKNHVS